MIKRILFGFLIFFSQIIIAQPISQFRGPNREGHYRAAGLLKAWSADGTELLWQAESLGDSYAAVSVYDGIVYTTGKIDESDYLTAVDSKGNQLWQVRFGDTWTRSFAATRSTPTVQGNAVYVISGMGEVVCLNRENGEIIWTRDVFREYEGKYESRGGAESPLIVDDIVVTTPAGNNTTMVALNKKTGKPMYETEWHNKGSIIYADGLLYRYDEKRDNVGITEASLDGFDIISSFRVEAGRGPHWAMPVIDNGKLYIRHGDVLLAYHNKSSK